MPPVVRSSLRVADAGAAANGVRHALRGVLFREVEQRVAVEVRRVHVFQGIAVADVPVADEVGVQQAGEADAAFQEGEVQSPESVA